MPGHRILAVAFFTQFCHLSQRFRNGRYSIDRSDICCAKFLQIRYMKLHLFSNMSNGIHIAIAVLLCIRHCAKP